MTNAATPPLSLAERAAQRRTLALTLEVPCPDRLHWHAREQVPCTPPDDTHPDGWVCLARIAFEVTTRDARHAHEEFRAKRERARKRRDHERTQERARIVATIHEAAHR